MSPPFGERISARAPASFSALTGSISSDSSKPSVAMTATRIPESSGMSLSFHYSSSIGTTAKARKFHAGLFAAVAPLFQTATKHRSRHSADYGRSLHDLAP